MNLRRSIILSAALLVAAACADPTGPDPRGPDPIVDLAFVDTDGVTVQIDGAEIIVDVITLGLNTCYAHHDDEVDVDSDARIISIRPYNERWDPEQHNVICGHEIVEIPHRIEIEPGASGDWLVRVIGRPTLSNGPTEVVVEVPANIAITIDNPTDP